MPQTFEGFPPTHGIRWFNVAILVLTPLLALYGLCTMHISRATGLFAVTYYTFSMLGE
jgi:stearoyl-CoA desaturase (delta-9 desaturase)